MDFKLSPKTLKLPLPNVSFFRVLYGEPDKERRLAQDFKNTFRSLYARCAFSVLPEKTPKQWGFSGTVFEGVCGEDFSTKGFP